MITAASVELYNALPQPLPVPDVPRGHPDFPMDAWDLVNFSRCPRRWVLGTPPVLKPKVSCSEVTPAYLRQHTQLRTNARTP